jgi:2-C-methyl-D-erythritol 2,4-cyclodiphosphate synthase
VRIGAGHDVHQLVVGRKLVLGGVEIPHNKGLKGHSDADVLVHSVCDALLGAAALGDIGLHFPDTDERYLDINSLILLENTGKLLYDNGFYIENLDATIVAQAPKLAPHRYKMIENIARSLDIEIARVSVKFTTTEGLGYVGMGSGMAAHCIALINKMTG